jgi:hypothetical protein
MTTDRSARAFLRGVLPFVLQGAHPRMTDKQQSLRDLPTAEEPLPPPLETDQRGHILAHETRLTKVGQETTDDN